MIFHDNCFYILLRSRSAYAGSRDGRSSCRSSHHPQRIPGSGSGSSWRILEGWPSGEGICIDECPACVSCVPFTARSFVLFADLDEPQRFKNRIVLPRKVGRKEKDFVLYRPSLGGCVWMPDGSSELSGFQKRRRLKHTASRRWTSWARWFWWGDTRRSTRCWNS